MDAYIEYRIIEEANFIIANESTVRKAAQKFGMSKTQIHKDMRKKLKNINPQLHEKVLKVIDKNKLMRYSRGGIATSKKTHRKDK